MPCIQQTPQRAQSPIPSTPITPKQSQALQTILHLVVGRLVVDNDVPLDHLLFVVTVTSSVPNLKNPVNGVYEPPRTSRVLGTRKPNSSFRKPTKVLISFIVEPAFFNANIIVRMSIWLRCVCVNGDFNRGPLRKSLNQLSSSLHDLVL